MKTLLQFFTCLLLIGLISCSTGKSKVPEVVKIAFHQKFPDAKEVEWEKEHENEWEAEFEKPGNEFSANFSADGNWMETEWAIALNALPAKVRLALETDYNEYEIEEVEFLENPSGSFYEIEVESNEKTLDLLFSLKGDLIKTETGKEDNDDDDGDDDDDEDDDENEDYDENEYDEEEER